MTHLQIDTAIAIYRLTYMFEALITPFKKIYKALLEARQREANYKLALMLHCEYRHETTAYILRLIEEGKINEINK